MSISINEKEMSIHFKIYSCYKLLANNRNKLLPDTEYSLKTYKDMISKEKYWKHPFTIRRKKDCPLITTSVLCYTGYGISQYSKIRKIN